MKVALLVALLSVVAFCNQEKDVNVNSRYTVESVEVKSVRKNRLTQTLKDELKALVGQKLDHDILENLAQRIRTELRERKVIPKVQRGTKPLFVKVRFETRERLDLAVPSFVYHSKEGWSGALDANNAIGDNEFGFGIVSDGDREIERYAGIRARFRRNSLGTEHLRLHFDFESYHQQWNRATLQALEGGADIPGIYRTRQNFQPALSVVFAQPVTLMVGASFQRFQMQFPAARTEASNAVITSLRHHRRWEHSELDAGYDLRAATRIFDSDFVYARHAVDAAWDFKRGDNRLSVRYTAGLLNGNAPLFDRFVAGNATLLRGWNKWDLAPLGGNRLQHGTIEYSYDAFTIFYDTGAIWESRDQGGSDADQKHSAGVGVRAGDFMLAVAFPIKSGRAAPVFFMGMNF
jgi:hypothetical protein